MIPDRPRLTIAPKHLALLFLPMLVVTASEAILSAFANTKLSLDGIDLAQSDIPELVGRYRFLAVFFFYVSSCVTVLAIFCADIYARHSRTSLARIAVGFVLLIAFSALFSMLEPEWMGSFEAYELVGARLFTEGLQAGQMGYCLAGFCGEAGAFHALRLLNEITNLASALAVSAVVLGMIVALARPGPIVLDTRDGLLEEAATLMAAQKQVRRYLYLAGLLLSVGMMLGYAWMHWPSGLIADPGVAQGYNDLVEAISLYRGVSYSVLILSFYMPVSLIQMVRIERLHAAAAVQGMPDVSEAVQGFDIERIGSLDALKAIV